MRARQRIFALFSMILCGAVCLGSGGDEGAVPALGEVRDRGFSVTMLDGEAKPLSDLLAGDRPVVVEFWATWCAPCRKTLPHLIDLNREYGDRLAVVGLTVEDPAKDAQVVRDYVKSEGIGFPVAFAPPELFEFMNDRPDIAVPKLFVFGSDGRVVAYIPRYSPFTSHKLKKAVEKALSEGERSR